MRIALKATAAIWTGWRVSPSSLHASITTATCMARVAGQAVIATTRTRTNWSGCATCVDADADTHFTGCDAYETVSGPDCDDGDSAVWNGCANCTDGDGDLHGQGCAAGSDCDDDDSAVWSDCSTCTDNDGDGYGTNCPLGGDCNDDDPAANVDCSFLAVLEAESGDSLGEMSAQQAALRDPACGGSWVEVPAGAAAFYWNAADPALPTHRTELSVDLPVAGTYYVWLRLATASSGQDALYVGFGASDMRRIYPPDTYSYDSSWIWVSEVPGAPDRLVFNNLTAGAHTLIIAHGEAGIRCDKVVVANEPSVSFDSKLWRVHSGLR